jgi:hypothetical protein
VIENQLQLYKIDGIDLNQGTGLTPKHLGLIDRPFVPP